MLGFRAPVAPPSAFGSGVPVVLLLLLLVSAMASGPASAGLKIYVDAPGVHAVDIDEVGEILGEASAAVLGAPRLSHCGRTLPLWRSPAAEPAAGTGAGTAERLAFLVPSGHFEPPCRRDGVAMIVLLLEEGEPEAAGPVAIGESGAREDERPAPVERIERLRRFEEDQVRAPLDLAAAEAGVGTWWYWKMISHQASSRLEIELGELGDRAAGDRAPDGDAGMVLALDLLGWSDPKLPDGIPHHHVDVRLNGEKVGEATWDGRRSGRFEIPIPASARLLEADNRLQLKIPTRQWVSQKRGVKVEEGEIVDLVYVDGVELRYRLDRPRPSADAPLLLAPSDSPRWLPPLPPTSASDSHSPEVLAVTADVGPLERDPRGGWILPPSPPTDASLELWLLEPSSVRAPLALEPTTPGALALPADLDYLMIAPRTLIPETERLADFHRQRGLAVAVVDVVAIYDAFGDGEKSPQALRRYIDHVLVDSPALRFLLLVGDADWLVSGDATPYLDPEPARRDRVPTFIEPSSYGPAASDHFYAADPADEANPRFAVGRLPVIDADELRAVVDKILRHVRTPRTGPETLLMVSDGTRPSLGRREKLEERIADVGFELRRPDEGGDLELDRAVIDALDRGPTVVYFGGHGSRYQWQLGETAVAGPATYFEREDVARLAPARRWPVALSISCATAPFDHPKADSLGEVMVLAPERGAIAFLGAGVRLYTPSPFSDELVRALAREATLGEAMVAAKRAAGQAHVSRLYNLLGDPALPLR